MCRLSAHPINSVDINRTAEIKIENTTPSQYSPSDVHNILNFEVYATMLFRGKLSPQITFFPEPQWVTASLLLSQAQGINPYQQKIPSTT